MKNKLLLILTLLSLNVFSQVPYMIKDINQSISNQESSEPSTFFEFNSQSLFVAETVDSGRELWITNGNTTGTRLVKDLNPGQGSSLIKNFVLFNNKVFFAADNGLNGFEVWSTDGTTAGTTMLANLNTFNDYNSLAIGDNSRGDISKFVVSGGKLYFKMIINSQEYLYATNGTIAGTTQIKSLASNSSFIDSEMYLHNNKIYFNSRNSAGNRAMYITDGTTTGTILFNDVATNDYYGTNFCFNNSGLYCIINKFVNNAYILEVSKINTTNNIATAIKQISTGFSTFEMFSWLNSIYFTANTPSEGRELWKSDGTVAGTSITSDLFPGVTSSNPTKLQVLNGDIIFEATNNVYGKELFKYNINANQTTVLKDITLNGSTNFDFSNRIVASGSYFFVIYNSSTGQPMFYQTDGTTAGTIALPEVVPGVNNINYGFKIGFLNGDLIMSKNYYSNNSAYNNLGAELYKYQIGFQSFSLIKDINTTGTFNTSISVFAKLNNDFIFSSTHKDFGNELWKTNKNPNNATLIKDEIIGTNSHISSNMEYIVYNNIMYYGGVTATTNPVLYKTDGTTAGTIQLKYANNSPALRPSNFILYNNSIYFLTSNGKLNKIVNDIVEEVKQFDNSLFIGEDACNVVLYNNEMYYLVIKFTSNTVALMELWKSNGTTTGTILVKSLSIPTAIASNNDKFAIISYNNILYFCGYSTAEGLELWKSDGTTVGTTLFKDVNVDASINSVPNSFLIYNNELFFKAKESVGTFLWKTDGTAIGTVKVKNKIIRNELDMVVFDSKLFFVVRDINVDQIWASNGTDAGTNLFFTVPNAPYLNSLFVYQNKLITDAVNSKEVYAINSFATPPYLYFNKIGNSGELLKNIDNNLFMTGNLNKSATEYGRELWALGNCNDTANPIFTVTTSNNTSNIVEEKPNANTTCYCDEWNALVTKLQSVGTTPYTGDVKSKVWIDATANQKYVKRHYQIYPQTNTLNATGKITLYYSQVEFNEYNALTTTNLLPSNPNDVANKANLLIERFAALSSNAIGNPESYATFGTTINPVDSDIVWNSTLSRWEVTFASNLFGGYFIKTSQNSLDIVSNNPVDTISFYPNPTSGKVVVNVTEQSNCMVYDFTGKLIKSNIIDTNENVIDISEFQNGIYILTIQNQSQTFSKKIIKQ